jgi:hypothetical protein
MLAKLHLSNFALTFLTNQRREIFLVFFQISLLKRRRFCDVHNALMATNESSLWHRFLKEDFGSVWRRWDNLPTNKQAYKILPNAGSRNRSVFCVFSDSTKRFSHFTKCGIGSRFKSVLQQFLFDIRQSPITPNLYST